jgi:hypothetical protein
MKTKKETRLHTCDVCGNAFYGQVWHCKVCVYHWHRSKDMCTNCYKGKSPVARRAKVKTKTNKATTR